MKAIIKNVTTTEYNQEHIAFAQTIDFSELFNHTKAFTGVTCNFNLPEISTVRGNVHITFTSENIVEQTGPFKAILKNCNFSSFSNGVSRNQNTNELQYWVSVDIMYNHKDGGSNGMEVVRAFYTESTGWIFHNVGER